MLHKSIQSTPSGAFSDQSPSPSPASLSLSRRGRGSGSARKGRSRTSLAVAGSTHGGGGAFDDVDGGGDGGGSDVVLYGISDGDYSDFSDTDRDNSAPPAATALGSRPEESAGDGVVGGQQLGGWGGSGSEGRMAGDGNGNGDIFEGDEEGTCDIVLEAVSTAGLQEELLGNHAFEVRKVLGRFLIASRCVRFWQTRFRETPLQFGSRP